MGFLLVQALLVQELRGHGLGVVLVDLDSLVDAIFDELRPR
jgi:hypothetical protein